MSAFPPAIAESATALAAGQAPCAFPGPRFQVADPPRSGRSAADAVAVPRAQAPSASRLVFVDFARSFAIIAALAVHALAVFSVWPAVPPGVFKGIANSVFSTATPIFFLLCGVMLELVYVQACLRHGGAHAARRLAWRAGQCWLGLMLGMLCAWWSGRIAPDRLGDAALSLIDTPDSGILRMYAAALLLCIPVVLLRPRLGPALPLALVGVIWAGAAIMPFLPWPAADSRWGFLCGFLVGHPPTWTAGSVWHDLSVVFLGMALGWSMRERQRRGLAPLGGRPFWLLTGFCAAGVAVCAALMGPVDLAHGYLGTGRLLRSECHPAYFLISTLSALILLRFAQACFPAGARAESVRLPILPLGRHSLLVFALGCAVLNLYPPRLATPPLLGLAYTVLYLAGIVGFAHLAEHLGKLRERLPANPFTHLLAKRPAWLGGAQS
jgi:hypothetical protein